MDSEALTQLRRLTGVRSLSLNQVKMGKQQGGIKAVEPVAMDSVFFLEIKQVGEFVTQER